MTEQAMSNKNNPTFAEWTSQYVADNIHKLKAPMVQDKKTGEFYDPKEAFDTMMNKPEIQAVFKRLVVR
jgi:hypothetical protein